MKKIAAVIVTFNSSNYIARLIDRLLSQSYPVDQIIIVDNKSTDNTCSIIAQYKNTHPKPKITLHQLDKNLGGAGGFSKCFEIAKNSDCAYIISFDDDAYPMSNNFIADMVACKELYKYDVLSALVVDTDNHKYLAYEYLVNGIKSIVTKDVQKVVLLNNDLKLFNGVLFDRKVVQQIGIPRSEFFIRGDEQEYKMRILSSGFKTAIFTQAMVCHPTSVKEYFYVNGERYHHLDSAFKLFYSTRNQAYMIRLREDINYLTKARIIYRTFNKYTWFYLIYKKDFRIYRLWIKAFIFGLVGYMKNDFRG